MPFELLKNITGAGLDVRKVGGIITPSIRISYMSVIGVKSLRIQPVGQNLSAFFPIFWSIVWHESAFKVLSFICAVFGEFHVLFIKSPF